MLNLEAYTEELTEREAIMNSAEFNAGFEGESRPAVCSDCGEYGCINQECFAARYDLPVIPATVRPSYAFDGLFDQIF